MPKRIERVNSLIEKELGKIILEEVDFPKDILVTITRVQTSVDLSAAKVYISVFPPDNLPRIMNILGKLIYFLQKTLDKKLRMRPIPRIRFVEEEQIEEAAKIEGILEGLKNKEK